MEASYVLRALEAMILRNQQKESHLVMHTPY